MMNFALTWLFLAVAFGLLLCLVANKKLSPATERIIEFIGCNVFFLMPMYYLLYIAIMEL